MPTRQLKDESRAVCSVREPSNTVHNLCECMGTAYWNLTLKLGRRRCATMGRRVALLNRISKLLLLTVSLYCLIIYILDEYLLLANCPHRAARHHDSPFVSYISLSVRQSGLLSRPLLKTTMQRIRRAK